MKWRTMGLAAQALLLLPALLFAGGAQEGPAEGAKKAAAGVEPLVVAISALPETLEPGTPTTQAMYRVSYNLFNNLIEFDFKGDKGLVPALAESWQQVDGKTLEVKLRKGVLFHNGEELTSEDVLLTFSPERLMGPKPAVGSTSARGYWQLFDRVEAVDRYTVRFYTKEVDPVMAKRLTLPVYQIVNKKAYTEAADFQKWSFATVGTGPYKVTEFVPYDHLTLVAHEGYWGGKPAVNTLIFKVVPEVSARVAGLLAGDYHLVAEIPPDLFKTIEADKNFEVVGGPIASFLGVFFNMHKPYMDAPLRRAMSMAIDRDLLIKTLLGGRSVVSNGMQTEDYGDMWVKEIPYPKYDPEGAKKLLQQSKYKGEAINYWILNDYYVNEVDTAQALVEMWKAVGINVQIEVKENWAQVNLEDGKGVRLLGMRNSSFTDLYMDPVGCMWRTVNPETNPQKYHNWQAEAFNRDGKILETNMDPAERYKAARRMLEFMEADPPLLLLHQTVSFVAKRKAIDWSAYRQVYMYFGPENFRQ